MKDFYMRLGVFPDSGRGILADAIDAYANKSVQAAARAILLSPERRSQYNAAHAQMKRIAQLRSNLGLRRTELWADCDASDFDVPPRGHSSQLLALRDSVSPTLRWKQEPAPANKDWTPENIRKAAAIVVGLALILWWALFSGRTGEPEVVQSFPAQTPASATTSNPQSAASDHLPTYEEVFGNRPPPAEETVVAPAKDPFRVTYEIPEPSLPSPKTGALTKRCRHRPDWPELRIHSSESSGDFYIKVLAFHTTIEKCRAFVRNGETVRLSLPDGVYEVQYASGSNWYGEDRLFGDETVLAAGVNPISLRSVVVDGGIELNGGELLLEKQLDGNFPDRQISLAEFQGKSRH